MFLKYNIKNFDKIDQLITLEVFCKQKKEDIEHCVSHELYLSDIDLENSPQHALRDYALSFARNALQKENVSERIHINNQLEQILNIEFEELLS